ncbi:MAG: PIG-L family deacetylase [Deltaproteobacteria bacterium]|nr:PIG-L family deacetylase [Deltaproteobacteria bacterium]
MYQKSFLLLFAGVLFCFACSDRPISKAQHGEEKRILLLLAHPDDETMLGSFLLQWRNAGHEVRAIYFTAGEGGKMFKGLDEHGQAQYEVVAAEELKKIRCQELQSAALGYGIDDHLMLDQGDVPLRDQQGKPVRDVNLFLGANIWDQGTIAQKIKAYVASYQADIVVTMSMDQDAHAHHKAVRFITQQLWDQQVFGKKAKLLLAVEEGYRIDSSKGKENLPVWQTNRLTNALPGTKKTYAEQSFAVAQAHQSQAAGHIPAPKNSTETLYIVEKR